MSFLNKTGQTWSFDLIIAVVLFIVIIGIFYAYLSNNNNDEDDQAEELSKEAQTISNTLDCDVAENDLCVTENGEINLSKLETIKGKDYELLKKQLEVNGDFCIYLRTTEGNIIPFNDTYGIGSDEFELAQGINCSQNIE
ncbi:MAG: hypothetical protein ACQESC_02630 [Nanobdellota archaeon]